MEKHIAQLQFISQGDTATQQLEHIKYVLDLGVDWIQVRFKGNEEKHVRELVDKVKQICLPYNAVCVVNDWVSVCKDVGVHGVHLGLQDSKVNIARNFLGAENIIGGTANTLEDVAQRIAEGCDYVGLGPYAFTTTKDTLSPLLGVNGYEKIIAMLPALKIPIIAIGGICEADLPLLQATGVYGVALSTALLKANLQQVERMKKHLLNF